VGRPVIPLSLKATPFLNTVVPTISTAGYVRGFRAGGARPAVYELPVVMRMPRRPPRVLFYLTSFAATSASATMNETNATVCDRAQLPHKDIRLVLARLLANDGSIQRWRVANILNTYLPPVPARNLGLVAP